MLQAETARATSVQCRLQSAQCSRSGLAEAGRTIGCSVLCCSPWSRTPNGGHARTGAAHRPCASPSRSHDGSLVRRQPCRGGHRTIRRTDPGPSVAMRWPARSAWSRRISTGEALFRCILRDHGTSARSRMISRTVNDLDEAGDAHRDARRSNCAFTATIVVLADIKTAPTAGCRTMPQGASTPAARGIATMLYPAAHQRF